jgi:hypothetical protein
MKSNIGISAGLAVLAVASSTSFGAILNLTNTGSSGTINGALFEQTGPQPTGTGFIDSFVRIKQTGNEAAYNTGGNLPNPFNQLGGNSFNRDLLLADVPIVNGKYQFLLDINESGNGIDPLLSLNQVQVFRTSVPGQTGGSWNTGGDGRLVTTGMTDLHPVYDMNIGGGTANGVLLNYDLNPGSGAGDMFLDIPTSFFTGVSGQYVLLYSQFGTPPGAYQSNDGFEEWAVISGQEVVPEPTTGMLAGAFLLIWLGTRLLNNRQKLSTMVCPVRAASPAPLRLDRKKLHRLI